jgi:phenylpropionate dioxygenase-like ring-hydroxylating dioxygenase large terminal subunit
VTDRTLLTNTHPALRRCWHPVARSREIGEQPVRVMLLGEPLVAFRSGGAVVVFADRCPHRGTPLSLGCAESGGVRCAYHGWRFDADGCCDEIPALGADAVIPARARLAPVAGVEERLGMVFVALGPDEPLPGARLPEVPEDGDPAFVAGDLPILAARASAGLLADNFLDTAHFPFVHAATFGAGEAREVGRFEVSREPGELAFRARYEHLFANREDPGVAAGVRPLVQTRRLTYSLVAPFHLSLRIDFVDAGGTNTIGFFLQPESEERCRIFSTIWRNDLEGDADRLQEAVDFEVKVVEEDLRIQEAFDRLALPLDPTVELHTRADRTTVELRRVLADLVAAADGGGSAQ